MKTLVTYGTKRGGTRGIAESIAEQLRSRGLEVDLRPAGEVRDLGPYQAVILGGALYAFHWHRDARRFVLRFSRALRRREVWFFSSGPLDQSAREGTLGPVPQVRDLMGLAACDRHVTFGGRLEASAKGFPAEAMARTSAGDFRDFGQISAWALRVASTLEPLATRPLAPAPRTARRPPLGWWTLFATCALTGLNAVGGGLALLAAPDGSALGLPLSLLRHSPFDDFRGPGLLLAGVVGLANLWAAAWLWRRAPFALLVSAFAGLTLVGWIGVQMVMLRAVHPLHLAFLGAGLGIFAESARRLRALFAELRPLGPPAAGTPRTAP